MDKLNFRNYLIFTLGLYFLSLSVVLELKGHVVMMSAEGLAAHLADRTGKPFGNVKVAFDVALILAS